MSSTMFNVFIVLLLTATATSSPFPLNKLFTANQNEVYPGKIIHLPDTSVIMSASATYFIRELGLNPKVVLLDSKDDQEVNIVLRVFRKSGLVIWARVFTQYESAITIALPSDSTLAITGYPSFNEDGDNSLNICFINVKNGSLRNCASDNRDGVAVEPEIIASGPNTLLLPANLVDKDFNRRPAVSIFDIRKRRYSDVVPLTGGGSRHLDSFGIYGAAEKGTACFLTSRDAGSNASGRATAEVFVHCFNTASSSNRRMRVRSLGIVPSFPTPRFTKITVAKKQVFIAYEQTLQRAGTWVSEIIVYKLDSYTLGTRNWFKRGNTTPMPRVIQLPVQDDKSVADSASFVAGLEYSPRRNGVAVHIWSALNITGQYKVVGPKRKIVLPGSGEYVFERPQQWLVFLGKNNNPVVVPVPVQKSSVFPSSFPKPYEKFLLTDFAISRSGTKATMFGLLQSSGFGFPTGPLFSYDIDVPYKQM